MKLVLKIFNILVILIITVSVLLFSTSFFLQDRVADIILKSLNKNIQTKLEVGSFRLSFLRKFPKASLKLKDVLIRSTSNFNYGSFTGINTDTLLAARFVSIEFSITDIYNGIYNIESIGIKDGIINIYTDTAGLVNYDIQAKNKSSANTEFSINLERINLTDIKACYNNLATRFSINGFIMSGRLKSRISEKNIDFTAIASMQIDSVHLYNSRIIKPIDTEINVSLQSSESGVLFEKGTLQIENYDFRLNGSVSSDNLLDLNITGNNLDLSKIRAYLPKKYLDLVSEYDPSGTLIIDCQIKGLLSRTSNPHIEINTFLKDGHISYGKSDLSINKLSFTGHFSNGSKNLPETSSVSINNLEAKLGSANYSGSFTITRFDQPNVTLQLNGRVYPGELKEFFGIQNISTAEGFVDFDTKIVKTISHKLKYSLSEIIDLYPQANLKFNSFSIGFKNDSMLFTQINGNLHISNSVKADNLQLTYKGQRIKIDGEFRNLPEWLTGRPVKMTALANVSFDRLIPEVFLKNTAPSNIQPTDKTAFILPGDVLLDINFKIDSMTYKTFSSSEIKGNLNYKPKLLTFKSLNMESLNGTISVNGFIVQDYSKSLIARGNINVTDIDVNKAFKTFHNFGQDFLIADNLAGSLSGSLSLLLPMDSLLNPQIKSITAEGKYLLEKGALINFDPVKQLSKFIELSELENINFEKLENDFFIRNNILHIPQMDVKSSAADLTVNGKHSFNNDYEYHIKMLLSEMLSKKRKKNKSNITEFGVVEDDGLGRTSFLLKIENQGDEVKVSYDVKAVGNEIKNNIKSERQTLKTILNQEYGWFKNDSAANPKPSDKPRFRITWGEEDRIKTTPDTTVVKKDGIFKNLLKKK